MTARVFSVVSRTADQLLAPPGLGNAFGFGSASRHSSHSINGKIINGDRFEVFAVPYWSAAGPLALVAALSITRILRRARSAAMGLCVKCGYDLRATPDRCPECGAVA